MKARNLRIGTYVFGKYSVVFQSTLILNLSEIIRVVLTPVFSGKFVISQPLFTNMHTVLEFTLSKTSYIHTLKYVRGGRVEYSSGS